MCLFRSQERLEKVSKLFAANQNDGMGLGGSFVWLKIKCPEKVHLGILESDFI